MTQAASFAQLIQGMSNETNPPNGKMFFGMTWPNNTQPCSDCPLNANATLLMDRRACMCDIFHYGPSCGLCRPEWDPATCDGSACAVGYVSGVPAPFIGSGSFQSISFNCSTCDTAAGFCRTTWAGANGAFCAPCADCASPGGTPTAVGTVNATCVCSPGFRGPLCDQCFPRFTGALCDQCAPGYVSSAPMPAETCDACDTGFCHGAFSNPDPDPSQSQTFNMTDLIRELENFNAVTSAFDGTGAYSIPDIFRMLPDPWVSQCAPCADCDPFYGAVEDSTCMCRQLEISDYPGRDYAGGNNYSTGYGPTCSLYAEAALNAQCFPASARVVTASGSTVRMDKLATGTHVLALHPRTGALGLSPVVAWWHHESGELTPERPAHDDSINMPPPRFASSPYTRLTTASGAALTLSAKHYVPASRLGCGAGSAWADAHLALPADVAVGHSLWVLDSSRAMVCSPVTGVEAVFERGHYAPVTAWGTVVVDGVAASSLVAYGSWPLAALKLHHAALVAAHTLLGRLGLALFDAAHAPFYARAGVAQPTHAAVARTLAAAAAAQPRARASACVAPVSIAA